MEVKFNFEDRLVKFAGDMILFLKEMPADKSGKYFEDQLTRSSCGAALNYGEAQGAESTRDFTHKAGIVLKELKESRVALKILNYVELGAPDQRNYLHNEAEELIAICATMIKNKRKA